MKKTPYQNYIKEVCDIISTDSLFRDKISQSEIIKVVTEKAASAGSYAECHEIIQEIINELRRLGDLHSKFKVYNPETTKYEDDDVNLPPEVRIIENCAYIKLSSFDGSDDEEIIKFAQDLQNSLKNIWNDQLDECIVDLRGNPGGNMDPMILGLGPLMERNPTAFFRFPDGRKDSWGYKDGTYYYNDELIYSISEPFSIKTQLPLAILIDNKTASSAEILTISLLNAKTKLFGKTTKNRTTGNAVYKLEDKSKLVLSTCELIDLNGNNYLSGIKPDYDVDSEMALNEAIKWLSQ